jgi:rod shape-determining protein MreC
VLLINDPTSGVGALLEKTRLQGVLHGTAAGEVVLERVMSDEQVAVGETVLTSGGDQIFPKGLPVGTIVKVGNGKELFLNIRVKPAANLSKLEEVLVLVEQQERQATADGSVRVRAADVLAQRLPSVPDKPAAEANAEGAAGGKAKPGAPNDASKPSGSAAASTAKNPSITNNVHSAPVAGQPAKAENLSSAVQKSSSDPDGRTMRKTAPAQVKPRNAGPGSATPASPKPSSSQADPQTPADESSPH